MPRLALLATAGLAAAFVSKSGPRAAAVVRAPAQTAMQMKLYDWKRREAAEDASVGATEFRVDNIKPAPGATKRKMRKGRGISAGQGATCGFGMRGQKSRSGRPMRAGFEGGQTPLYRRLPKLVGRPTGPGHQNEVFSLIKLEQLAIFRERRGRLREPARGGPGDQEEVRRRQGRRLGGRRLRAGRPHGQGARLHGLGARGDRGRRRQVRRALQDDAGARRGVGAAGMDVRAKSAVALCTETRKTHY